MKEYPPYDVPGRWYKIFIESDNDAAIITESDIDVSIEGNYLKMPKDFHLLDRVYDINSVEHTGFISLIPNIGSFADGCQAVYIPNASAFDYADIYVFGYFK